MVDQLAGFADQFHFLLFNLFVVVLHDPVGLIQRGLQFPGETLALFCRYAIEITKLLTTPVHCLAKHSPVAWFRFSQLFEFRTESGQGLGVT